MSEHKLVCAVWRAAEDFKARREAEWFLGDPPSGRDRPKGRDEKMDSCDVSVTN